MAGKSVIFYSNLLLFTAQNSTADAFLTLRPSLKELESMGSEFAEGRDKFFKDHPVKSVAMITTLAGYETPFICRVIINVVI